VAIETVEDMIRHHTWLSGDADLAEPQGRAASQRTHQMLYFQLQKLKSLKARSDSNQARLQNEITLVGWESPLAVDAR
jgi:hypothetical protein